MNDFRKENGQPRTMAICLYDQVAIIDYAATYAAIDSASNTDLEIVFVGAERGTVSDVKRRHNLACDKAFSEVSKPDILLIPGGNHYSAIKDQPFMEWLINVIPQTELVLSGCSGGVILAATGFMKGKSMTTNLLLKSEIEAFEATYEFSHFVKDGKFWTSSGVSGMVEMGLQVVKKFVGEKVGAYTQYLLHYHPNSVFNTGDPFNSSNDFAREVVAYMQLNNTL